MERCSLRRRLGLSARALLLLLPLCAELGCGDAVAEPIRVAPWLADDAGPRAGTGGTAVGVPEGEHCAAAATWPAPFAADERALLAAINERRAAGIRCGDGDRERAPRRRAPLVAIAELTCSARLHSLDMFTNGYVGRENREGDDFRDRIRATGLVFAMVDESIEDSDASPEGVLELLLDDWDDCANLVSSELDGVGIGRYEDRWTLDFAALP